MQYNTGTIPFTSKGLSIVKTYYDIIEIGALGIMPGSKKF